MFCTSRSVSALLLSLVACAMGKATSATPRMPFAFAENRGQAAPEVRFTGTGSSFKAWFGKDGVILQQRAATIRETFVGGSFTTIYPEAPLGAQANYLRGNDPHKWQTGVPLYGAIRYGSVWPGIDIRYRANEDSSGGSHVKAEYIVAAGSSPDAIRLRFEGATSVEDDGSLRVHGGEGDLVEDKPFVYQDIGGVRRAVEGSFERHPDGTIGFRISEWDRSYALVIDPSILFSGYFGGSSQDSITAVAIDSAGNVDVAGWSSSTDLPVAAGAHKKSGGGVDAFIASFNPIGAQLRYCTYLGGSGDDRAFGIALDTAQNIYITGQTSSANFPVLSAVQTKLSGSRDAFVAKLNAAGTAFLYSTFLGGTGVDAGNAIAVNAAGAAIIFGDTTSTALAVTSGVFQNRPGGAQDTFVAKLSAAGNSLSFLTFLGGAGNDHAATVRLDPANSIFLGGYTWSANFPVLSAWQARSGGGQDGFVTKLASDGTHLLFSTYLGGSGGTVGAPEQVTSLAIDLLGNVIVGGATPSTNFPVTSQALQTTLGGQSDGFIARFSGAGSLLQSTFVGGTLADSITAIALDYHGDVYATGSTVSEDFPVVRAQQSSRGGNIDAFVVKISPQLSSVVFGTYLGGDGSETGQAIAVDFYGSAVVAGQTSSSNFPVAHTALRAGLPAVVSAFLTKIVPPFNLVFAFEGGGSLYFAHDFWRLTDKWVQYRFGITGDVPVLGDWDGSGVKRIGVFRNGTWYLDIANKNVLDGSVRTVSFGQAGDVPLVGDWTGTGHPSLGLFRAGTFILDLSGHLSGVPTGQSDATFSFGQAGDKPVVADWSGSGTTKVGVYRNGLWLVDYNGDRAYTVADRSYNYGYSGDTPLTGDWDGSGNTNIGVFHGGFFILDYDGDHVFTLPYLNEMIMNFGPGVNAGALIF